MVTDTDLVSVTDHLHGCHGLLTSHGLVVIPRITDNFVSFTIVVYDVKVYIYIYTHTYSRHTQISKKVKESRNRSGVAQRVLGGLGAQIPITFGTWRWCGCGEVNLTHRPPLPPGNVPGTHCH